MIYVTFIFRFVRCGIFLTNGDPPTGSSFKTIQCSYLRIFKQKYGRSDLDYDGMFTLNAAISEMKGLLKNYLNCHYFKKIIFDANW
jgi:hypothetical protein